MKPEEAEAIKEGGERILEQLGHVPIAYGLTCELPAAHGEPLSELDRVWMDRFEAADRDWIVVLNGDFEHRRVDALGLVLEAGAAYVVCDETRLGKLTPFGGQWHFDPDTGEPLTDEKDRAYFEDLLIEAVHARLTEKGKDLPDLQEIVSDNN